jgi:glutamine synthetase
MAKSKLEYIWLDGYKPTQNLRSKTKVINNFSGKLQDCPIWSFDGSSTQQAEGNSSDCLLKPVAIYPDPAREDGYLVMNEVLNPDGTPHVSNSRATIDDGDNDFWFGFEQEYFIMDVKTQKPLGFPIGGYPGPQGLYYCSVGGKNTWGREFVEEHADLCIAAGLAFEGINQEVAAGQWEFQLFAKGAKRAGDEIWIARYMLDRLTEQYGYYIEYHPKPITGDWNGSGMHANFSNTTLRTCGSKEIYMQICEAFRPVAREHIEVYGAYNEMRLTGRHETASINEFKYGVSDRGASIRIPIATVENNWKGWLEDRRPASNADPYKVASIIVKTVKGANITAKGKSAPKAKAVASKAVAKKSVSKVVEKKKDDLTKVEGIGPKIQALLNASGVKTYGELSAMSAKKIKTILSNAGNKFSVHDPKTWPAQAKLAAEGQWDKLSAWQVELNGGK